MPPITGLTRIEPVYLDRLEKQGVFTTGILLEVSETATRRQYLADHVAADILDVLKWRDEALMLNLAAFGPAEHLLLAHAGFDGLQAILTVDVASFQERIRRAAQELKVEPPNELTMVGWWEQARTLETPTDQEAESPGGVGALFLRLVIGIVVGALGAAVASLIAPSDPPLLAVVVVGAVLVATGVVGRVAAGGVAGLAGLLLGATLLLLVLLGQTILIALPDTPLWHDQGLAFPLGPGPGLIGLFVGWIGAYAAVRIRGATPTPARGTAA